MRRLILAALVGTSILGTSPLVSPAEARERVIAWCARKYINYHDYYDDCMYYTYAQCRAAVSGLPGECIRNPFTSYGYGPPVSRPRYQYR